MSELKRPTEKLSSTPYHGKEVIDELGRKIKLKRPDAVDEYNLLSALNKDSDKPSCVNMMLPQIYVQSIDGIPFEPASTLSECKANLKKLKHEGIKAVIEQIFSENSQNEIEEIKK